jgi:hypothetical protein
MAGNESARPMPFQAIENTHCFLMRSLGSVRSWEKLSGKPLNKDSRAPSRGFLTVFRLYRTNPGL